MTKLMIQGLALLALAAFVATASAEPAHTEADLQRAREFIASQLEPEKRAMLEDMAKKAGTSPEQMFLDIAKLTGDQTLGTSTALPNIPSQPGIPSGIPNIPPPPPPNPPGNN